MNEAIEKAKNDFAASRDRLITLFANTPDDRVNWAPSATARSPIELVVHSAESVKNIHQMLLGHKFAASNVVEADKMFRAFEGNVKTREEAQQLFQDASANYVAWLETVTPEMLDTMIPFPFHLGFGPLAIGLTFPPLHTQSHCAQLEYLQTIYGDRDWYLG